MLDDRFSISAKYDGKKSGSWRGMRLNWIVGVKGTIDPRYLLLL
jgi:hypothetical protein